MHKKSEDAHYSAIESPENVSSSFEVDIVE